MVLTAGCQDPMVSAPPTLRKLILKSSPTPSLVLTKAQIEADLLGKNLSVEGEGRWTFDSLKEFQSIEIVNRETDGDQEIDTVQFELVGDPTGEEAEATARLIYKRAGDSWLFQSITGEKFEVTDDRRYIGVARFPAGETYTKSETQTYQFGEHSDPAEIRYGTEVSLMEDTDSYQKFKVIDSYRLIKAGDQDAPEISLMPQSGDHTSYVTRYEDGTRQIEGGNAHDLAQRDDLIPRKKIAVGSTWRGRLPLGTKQIDVDVTATEFGTYNDRRSLVLEITNSDTSVVTVSGRIILDDATALPLRTDIRYDLINADGETGKIQITADGTFTE